jgi:hypothetical protein
MQSTSSGTSRRTRSSAAQPSVPSASKKATLILTATACPDAASMMPRAKVSIPATVGGRLSGS